MPIHLGSQTLPGRLPLHSKLTLVGICRLQSGHPNAGKLDRSMINNGKMYIYKYHRHYQLLYIMNIHDFCGCDIVTCTSFIYKNINEGSHLGSNQMKLRCNFMAISHVTKSALN